VEGGEEAADMRKSTLLLIILIIAVIVARYAVGNYEARQRGAVTEVYVIRGPGSLFMDFNIKLLYAVTTVVLIAVGWRQKGRSDYLWIAVTGTLIAAILEGLAILSGERQFQVNYLFGVELPLLVDLALRGAAEFAFYAVAFLWLADGMLKETAKKTWVITFAVVTIVLSAVSFANGIRIPNYGGDVPSRRAMTGTGSLILMGIIAYATLAFFLTKPRSDEDSTGSYLRTKPTDGDRRRGLHLAVLLTIYFAVGQLTEYLAGVRWVEIGAVGATQHAPPLVELIGLIYNVVFEGTLFYVPYYTIPVGLGLVKSSE